MPRNEYLSFLEISPNKRRSPPIIDLQFASNMPPFINRIFGINTPQKTLRQILLILVLFACAHVAFPRYIVATDSMEPSIPRGSYVLASRIHPLFTEPANGDIVVFAKADGISELPWMHRIVGDPGMRIADFSETRDKQTRRDILSNSNNPPATGPTIPPQYYYQSGDSPKSYHGLVPRETIIAKVLFHFRLPWTKRANAQPSQPPPHSR